jgi:hypothetical protein
MIQRHELHRRMVEIQTELKSISELRVVDGDPVETEAALLHEHHRLGARLDSDCCGR